MFFSKSFGCVSFQIEQAFRWLSSRLDVLIHVFRRIETKKGRVTLLRRLISIRACDGGVPTVPIVVRRPTQSALSTEMKHIQIILTQRG